eukprot:SAG31_NODE_45947_length_256_cov_1.305732_1_plen_49_part_01
MQTNLRTGLGRGLNSNTARIKYALACLELPCEFAFHAHFLSGVEFISGE